MTEGREDRKQRYFSVSSQPGISSASMPSKVIFTVPRTYSSVPSSFLQISAKGYRSEVTLVLSVFLFLIPSQ